MGFKKFLNKILPPLDNQVKIPIKTAKSLEITPICETEKEYNDRMILSIGGFHRKVGIIKRPDMYSLEDLLEEKMVLESIGAYLIVPSIIFPTHTSNHEWIAYIVLFTHNNKLFMCPADYDAFSDIGYKK